jgi:putative ABC transport system permease protein
MYRSEKQTAKLFKYFAILAILISCLGLFGLASFMTEQRQKEIGIRKVMGSKVGQLMILLTREFTKWVFIAGIIGLPLGYFAMNRWLQGFHYRIEPSLLVFIIALFAALAIAGFTVSLQTYRASVKNPVDTLRDE